MDLKTLEKLEKNPFYKLSAEQQAELDNMRVKRFKNNPKFIKHDLDIKQEPKARELKNDKATDRN